MELNKIQSTGSWGKASEALNRNFEHLNADVEKLKNASYRNKGYYATKEELEAAYPSANIGDKAYVGNSGSFFVWVYENEGWVNTGISGGGEDVNLGDYYTKQEVNDIIMTPINDASAYAEEAAKQAADASAYAEEAAQKATETANKAASAEESAKAASESALSAQESAAKAAKEAADAKSLSAIAQQMAEQAKADSKDSLETSISNRYGYNVTVYGIKGGVHTLASAVKDVPVKHRMLGQKITFRTENGDWATYHNKSLSADNYTNPEDWEIEVGVTSVTGDINITNAPDYEDLTEAADGTIKFADKEHHKESFSGLGRVYLRKNIVEGVNVLTQDMLSKANTIYVIQYDYDLKGAEITIPEGCVLDFQGGSLSNGKIIFSQTKLKGNVCLRVKVGGKIKGGVSLDWFAEDSEEVSEILNDLAQCSSYISIPADAKYLVSQDVYLTNLIKIEGHGNSVLVMNDATMYVAYANILRDFTLQISNLSDVPEGGVPKSALVIDEHHVMSSIDDNIEHNRGWSNSRIILDNLYFVTKGSENFQKQESAAFSILGNGNSLYSGYWSITLTDIKVVADTKYGCYINGRVNPEIDSWLNTIRFTRCNIQNNIYPWYILNSNHISFTECSTQCARDIMISPVYMRNTYAVSFDNSIFHDTHVLVNPVIDADHTCYRIHYIKSYDSVFPFGVNKFPRGSSVDLNQNYIPIKRVVAPIGENAVLSYNQIIAIPKGKYMLDSETIKWFALTSLEKSYMIVDEHGKSGTSIRILPVTLNNSTTQYCYQLVYVPSTNDLNIGEFLESDKAITSNMWRDIVMRGRTRALNYGSGLKATDISNLFEGWHYFDTNTNNLTVYNGEEFIRYDGYTNAKHRGSLDTLVNINLKKNDYGYLFYVTNKNKYVVFDYNDSYYKSIDGFSISSHRGETDRRPFALAPLYQTSPTFPTYKSYMYLGYTILMDEYYIITNIDDASKVITWTKESDVAGKTIPSDVKRYGLQSQRPSANDIYVGFEYIDVTFGRRIYAKSINDGVVTWADRGIDYLRKGDTGFQYYDTDLQEWLIAKNIATYGGITWISANKPDISTSGKYANKPINAPVGHQYFCTDRKTSEGNTDGVMIYHKGNNVWVDALGRVVE